MSRLLRLIFLPPVLLLCLTMLFSCKPGKDPGKETEPPVPGVPLVENGECRFRIVRSDLSTPDTAEVKAALLIKKAVKAVTGAEASLVTDWEDKDGNADIPEILIGKTNRTASETAIASLGTDEYLVKLDGNKLVIVGDGENALEAAVSLFLQRFVGYTSETVFTPAESLSLSGSLEERMKIDNSAAVAIFCTNSAVTYTNDLLSSLKAKYPKAELADPEASPASVFDAKKYDLVILAGADRIPAGTTTAIDAYLKKGGRLLTLGGPAFTTEVYYEGGEWLSRADFLKETLSGLDDSEKLLVFDTSNSGITGSFYRTTNTPGHKSVLTVGDYGLEDSKKQLKLEVSDLDSWDVFNYNTSLSGEGWGSIGFYAKGAEDTEIFYVEITEKDGTRWYAAPQITSEWDYYFLSALDFKFWDGDRSRANGTPEFGNIKTFSFGFAQSGAVMPTGHHELYLSMPTLLQYDGLKKASDVTLAIDGLSPAWELFPITNGASIAASPDQCFVPALNYKLTDNIVSCTSGRQGTGFGNGKAARFVPLIEVKDKDGLHSGWAAWMNVLSSEGKQNGSYEGAVIASFGPTDNGFYNSEGLSAVVGTVDAMLLPSLLVEGGTDEYLYVENEDTDWKAGARFVLYDKKAADRVSVKISLYEGDTLLKEYTKEKASSSASGVQSFENKETIGTMRPDRAVTELLVGGKTVDKIVQKITFWSPKPESERHYITKEDGYFKQDGKILRFFGVNYMPSDGIADPDFNRFCHYTLKNAYDPAVIEDDLLHIKSLGMNAVAIAVGAGELSSNNFIDLLVKCENLGLYCDVYIGTATEDLFYGSSREFTSLMDGFHLRDFDHIVCFDIAWEPRLGTYEDSAYIGRKRFDADWRAWIDTQYGSLSAAELLWGVKCPQSGGKAIGVTEDMLNDKSGTYDRIVAAYRRFIDDIIGANFTKTFNYLRSLDGNHLFTFRMSMAGSAYETQYFTSAHYCYDFMSLASSVSLMQPEGYALDILDDTSMLQILFANAYARYAQPDAPVVWKEYGKTVWYGSNFGSNSYPCEGQREYYEKVLSHALAAESDAMYCWFYAGGYRVDEKSDYGIFNPDGSPRPAAELLREYAPKFLGQGERKEADITLVLERDDGARGIFDMFDECKETLRKAFAEGKTVKIVNRKQSESADTLTEYAVGGTDTDGKYPLRYVNGAVRAVEKVTKDGKNVLRVTVVNTLPSLWKAGTVSVVDEKNGKSAVIGEDVPYLGTAVVEIETGSAYSIRFEVGGVAFGPAYTGK